ncbi:hypothetical protein V8C26DRAFT_69761 [Trichoderma gracile]
MTATTVWTRSCLNSCKMQLYASASYMADAACRITTMPDIVLYVLPHKVYHFGPVMSWPALSIHPHRVCPRLARSRPEQRPQSIRRGTPLRQYLQKIEGAWQQLGSASLSGSGQSLWMTRFAPSHVCWNRAS